MRSAGVSASPQLSRRSIRINGPALEANASSRAAERQTPRHCQSSIASATLHPDSGRSATSCLGSLVRAELLYSENLPGSPRQSMPTLIVILPPSFRPWTTSSRGGVLLLRQGRIVARQSRTSFITARWRRLLQVTAPPSAGKPEKLRNLSL